ncbi:putative fimbrial anchor domain protein, partial [Yersinia pestis PY-66]
MDNLSGIDNLAYGQLDEDKHHAILSEIEKKHRDNEIPTKTRDQAKNFLDKAYKVNQISTITKIVEEHIDY